MENVYPSGHELRYALNQTDYQTLRSRLTAAGTADGGRGSGWVHTLGFANYIHKALPGREERTEARFALRYYNSDPTFLLLERREGETTATAMVAEAECRALLAGETSWLAERHDPVLRDFHAGLTERMLLPQMMLTFHREVYTADGLDLWVALDTNIRASLQHMDFLDPQLLEQDMEGQEGRILMEVSYSDRIPDDVLCLLEETAPRRRLLSSVG